MCLQSLFSVPAPGCYMTAVSWSCLLTWKKAGLGCASWRHPSLFLQNFVGTFYILTLSIAAPPEASLVFTALSVTDVYWNFFSIFFFLNFFLIIDIKIFFPKICGSGPILIYFRLACGYPFILNNLAPYFPQGVENLHLNKNVTIFCSYLKDTYSVDYPFSVLHVSLLWFPFSSLCPGRLHPGGAARIHSLHLGSDFCGVSSMLCFRQWGLGFCHCIFGCHSFLHHLSPPPF